MSCSTKTTSNEKPEHFDWLLGRWQRTNEAQGKATFENWVKTTEFSYLGIGFILQDGDTIKQERMELVKHYDAWHLKVKVPEETETVTFKMTGSNQNSFICMNDSIDFPNRIKYWKENKKLKATVSGTGLNIPFEFEKIE
ncbi:hypothetical protein GO009_06770 [Muricauda sp. TY007]|nr:hypothetical protein [Muricauda sp. TY007]